MLEVQQLRFLAARSRMDRNYAEAESLMRKVVAIEPDDSRHALELGWAIFRNRDLQAVDRRRESGIWLRKARLLDPRDANVRFSFGAWLMDVGNAEASIRELKAALKADPDHRAAREALESLTGESPETS